MSILNELNILFENKKEIPILQDNDLAKSLFNLVKFNNGFYKSDKQCWFIQNKAKSGKAKLIDVSESAIAGIETKFNKDYGIIWRYILDDKGVLQQIKRKWKWKPGMSKAEVDKNFKNMSLKSRERNWGLQDEMKQGEWQYVGDTIFWKRN